MAGDLFIQNISTTELAVLTAAGATLVQTIQHSNRPWATYQYRLTAQLATTVNNRVNLPAHAYIGFNGGSQDRVAQYIAQNPSNRTTLHNLLMKISRPLGVVSANPNLVDWPANKPKPVENLLMEALAKAGVTIEFYQVDGKDLLTKFPSWAQVVEH